MIKCPNCGTALNLPYDINKNYRIICLQCNQRLYFSKDTKNISLDLNETVLRKGGPYVFFSHSFLEEDKVINDLFSDLLLCLHLNVISIEYDSRPRDKVEKARTHIKDSELFLVVLPKRHKCYDKNNKLYWKSSDWQQNEIGMAAAFDKDMFAVIEKDMDDEGMLKDICYCFKFDRENFVFPWVEDNLNLSESDIKDLLRIYLEFMQPRVK